MKINHHIHEEEEEGIFCSFPFPGVCTVCTMCMHRGRARESGKREREREREMPISHSVLGVKYCTQEGGKLGGETRREIEENGAQKVPSLEVERRHLSFVP